MFLLEILPILCIAIAMILMTTTSEESLRRLVLAVVLFVSGSVGATVLILVRYGLNILYIVPAIMLVFTAGFLYLVWKNRQLAKEEQRAYDDIPTYIEDAALDHLRQYHTKQVAYHTDEAQKSLYGAGLTFLVAGMSWALVFFTL